MNKRAENLIGKRKTFVIYSADEQLSGTIYHCVGKVKIRCVLWLKKTFYIFCVYFKKIGDGIL